MGPIPWEWLCIAANQPGKALHVAIAVWFLAFMNRSGKISLSTKVLKMLGVDRHSSYRGLRRLEEAQLVEVERHSGRIPIVTILDISKVDGIK